MKVARRVAFEPGSDEALIRVTSIGLFGSNLHRFQEAGIGDARLEQPLILSCEFAGRTEYGECMALDPSIPCGTCEYCRTISPNRWPRLRFAGLRGLTIKRTRRITFIYPRAIRLVESGRVDVRSPVAHPVL